MIELKKWYKSKTLWANIIYLIALLVQEKYGFIISIEEQLAVLAIINLILRAVTKEELKFN